MLAFSEEQFDGMAVETFLERVIGIIAEADPNAESQLRTADGRRILHEQYDKALQYGLAMELETAQYILTAWLLGTDFDIRFPAMQEILIHPKLSASQKANGIEQTATMLLELLKSKGQR